MAVLSFIKQNQKTGLQLASWYPKDSQSYRFPRSLSQRLFPRVHPRSESFVPVPAVCHLAIMSRSHDMIFMSILSLSSSGGGRAPGASPERPQSAHSSGYVAR